LVDKAIENVKNLLSSDGVFIMSDPLGYNKDFDNKVLDNKYGFQKRIYLKRKGYRVWEVVEKHEIEDSVYDAPFNAANALVICYYNNSQRI
jgi:hypothetical protein